MTLQGRGYSDTDPDSHHVYVNGFALEEADVPEPGTFGILGAVGLCLAFRRRVRATA